MSNKAGIDFNTSGQYPATELSAGTPIDLTAPQEGFIVALRLIVQTAIVTGGTVGVKIGTTDVPGLTAVAVADAATKGTIVTAAATKGADGRYVKKGDRIQLIASAAFNGGGALGFDIEFNSSQPNPALG